MRALPRPSFIVRSGTGIHGYWLLDREIHAFEERSRFVAMLPHFYRSFGGDHVQNLSRVLRLPGTMNLKDARSGRPPLPCTFLACDPYAALSAGDVFALDPTGGERSESETAGTSCERSRQWNEQRTEIQPSVRRSLSLSIDSIDPQRTAADATLPSSAICFGWGFRGRRYGNSFLTAASSSRMDDRISTLPYLTHRGSVRHEETIRHPDRRAFWVSS